MNIEQIIYALYNFINFERVHLDEQLASLERRTNRKSDPELLFKFYSLRQKKDFFDEFSGKVIDILSFYKSGDNFTK